mmetsp:Transcript_33690/g.41293  ORF Transcript_33690/g.41293 Transcript_33690/m.41293 type:complete len:178 (-) Transcript_33690:133-666(-)
MALERLKPFFLLGNYNALELWPLINITIPCWLLLAFAPKWKYTPVLTILGPMFFALLYTLSLLSLTIFGEDASSDQIDFSSLEGIVTLFSDPDMVFVGWVHYIVYDTLVGRWMVLDAIKREGHTMLFHVVVMVPILFLALMFGPFGWLLYVAIVRPIANTLGGGHQGDKTKAKVHQF